VSGQEIFCIGRVAGESKAKNPGIAGVFRLLTKGPSAVRRTAEGPFSLHFIEKEDARRA